jgi:hypothetical protein
VSNFTDLEDAIADCWNIVEDLRNFVKDHPEDHKLKILKSFADVYDYKFDRMFDLREDCLRDYYAAKVVTKASWGDEESQKRMDIIGSNGNIGYEPGDINNEAV